MAFIIGSRARLIVDDGDYAGVEAEFETINAFPVYYLVVGAAAAYAEAEGAAAELEALNRLYELAADLGRPVWNITDPHGPIPATPTGMLRVPVPLMLQLVDLWTETFIQETPTED